MRVSPWTSGISSAMSSRKHQDHSSPGSSERMSGWPLLRACALAWRLGESSQQATFPHSRQIRRCSHGSPVAQAILAARDGLRELGDVNVIEMGAGGHLICPFRDGLEVGQPLVDQSHGR